MGMKLLHYTAFIPRKEFVSSRKSFALPAAPALLQRRDCLERSCQSTATFPIRRTPECGPERIAFFTMLPRPSASSHVMNENAKIRPTAPPPPTYQRKRIPHIFMISRTNIYSSTYLPTIRIRLYGETLVIQNFNS